MREHDTVTYEREGNVAVATIDRPGARKPSTTRRPAASGRRGGVAALRRRRRRPRRRSHGRGHFCSGADLKEMDLEDPPEGWLGCSRMDVSEPTVAAAEGAERFAEGEGRGGEGL